MLEVSTGVGQYMSLVSMKTQAMLMLLELCVSLVWLNVKVLTEDHSLAQALTCLMEYTDI